MKIKFLGAAEMVTGSSYLISTDKTKFLIDFGLFQGGKDEEEMNQLLPLDPEEVDFMILTHAHIDHSGRIPLLTKHGFRRPIYCTKATRDLCEIMLLDSARIQEADIKWENRRRIRSGKVPLEPLYTEQDAANSLHYFRPSFYKEVIEVNEWVKIRFQDAGHMLGSSSVEIWLKENNEITKFVFSGDLGMTTNPLLNNPTFIDTADYLILESTYGNREHENYDQSVDKLIQIINDTVSNNGTVIIPSFAVGRTQEIIYQLNHYYASTTKLPEYMKIPIYVDSPMAVNATKAFYNNTDDFNEIVRDEILSGDNVFKFDNLHYIKTSDESIMLNNVHFPRVIISSSGMATGGRVRHHLKHNLWDEKNACVFVGYQAQNTLGRMLVDGVDHVKLLGEEISVKAKICTIDGFSGHADCNLLIDFVKHFKMKPKKIFVTHGELEEAIPLKMRIEETFQIPCEIPKIGEEMVLSSINRIQEEDIYKERLEKDLFKDLQIIKQNFDQLANKHYAFDTKKLSQEEFSELSNTMNELRNKIMTLNMKFGK